MKTFFKALFCVGIGTVLATIILIPVVKSDITPITPEYISNEMLIEDFNSFDSTAVINSIYGHSKTYCNRDSVIEIVIQYKDSLFYYKSDDTYAKHLFKIKQDGDYLK